MPKYSRVFVPKAYLGYFLSRFRETKHQGCHSLLDRHNRFSFHLLPVMQYISVWHFTQKKSFINLLSIYRGAKSTGWEGAVRGVSMVYYPRGESVTQRTSDCLFHVTDWIPTLISMYDEAGGKHGTTSIKCQ